MKTDVQTIHLWPGGIPGARQNPDYKEAITQPWGADCFSRISQPRILFYPACERPETRDTVLVCPGGGYEFVSIINEGYEVAAWLNRLGLNAAILLYRLPSPSIMERPAFGPLLDAREAMRALRKHLSRDGAPARKCGVMGFSAGGHLAASLSVHWDKDLDDLDRSAAPERSCRPDFSLLIYPVISMRPDLRHAGSTYSLLGTSPEADDIDQFSADLQVRATTPEAFLVHSGNDGAVNWRNSLAYFEALRNRSISAELHLFPEGGHGYGLAGAAQADFNPALSGQPSIRGWTSCCEAWLSERGLCHPAR